MVTNIFLTASLALVVSLILGIGNIVYVIAEKVFWTSFIVMVLSLLLMIWV